MEDFHLKNMGLGDEERARIRKARGDQQRRSQDRATMERLADRIANDIGSAIDRHTDALYKVAGRSEMLEKKIFWLSGDLKFAK